MTPSADAAVLRGPTPRGVDAVEETPGPSAEVADDPGWSAFAAAALREVAATVAAERDSWREAAPGGTPWPGPFRDADEVDAPLLTMPREMASADAPGGGGSAGADRSPWPEDGPAGAVAGHDVDRDPAEAPPPGPTHDDWRQLSDEVRRLAAQIAHGRA